MLAEPTVIRVGLVGFGMSARVFHAPFIVTHPGFQLAAVLERSRNEAAALYPYVHTVRSMEELLERTDIDLVVITTPNNTHFPYAAMALEAGRHVVLEKPFTNTTEEAATLVSMAQQSKGVLSVYQNRRYVGDFRTIRQIMQRGWLGDVHEYICHFDRYRPEGKPNAWREEPLPGSGILYDLGSHLIDQALCLFGLPLRVTAFIKHQRPHARTDDYFDLRLDYPGSTAILKSGMLVRQMGPRYAVHGTMGSFIKHGDDPQEALLKDGHLPVGEGWGQESEWTQGLLHTDTGDGPVKRLIPTEPGNFGDYYSSLYRTLVHGAPLSERPEHGYNTIRLIELALQSHAEQRTIPVTGLMDVPYPDFV